MGTLLLVLLSPSSSPVLAGAGSLIMGFGMGLLNISALILTQDSVGWTERGSATASNVFSRNLGSTLGAAVLGTVLSYGLAHSANGPLVTPEEFCALLNGTGAAQNGAAERRLVLQDALHATFQAMLRIAVLIVPVCLLVPRPQQKQNPAA